MKTSPTTFALAILVVGTAMLVADLLWLRLNAAMYRNSVAAVQHAPLRVRAPWAGLAYAFMILGVAAVAIPAAGDSLGSAAIAGAMLGLVVYGVFNATNAAIFAAYPARMAVRDTLWGTAIFAGATVLFALILGSGSP